MSKGKPTLNDFGIVENNHYYWWASWYAKILGYQSLRTLQPSIEKAKKVCLQLGIPVETNFIPGPSEHGADTKLTKFACFLIALQADARKPVVGRARTYFLNELEELNVTLSDEDYLSRMIGRDEIRQLNSQLSQSASWANVKDFRFFMNEGYLGMYNKTMSEVKQERGVPANKNLSDYMSMTELGANIFRITLTAARLKQLKNPSQESAAREHWKIGAQIRSMIKENTGTYPEELPLALDLKTLQKRLRQTQLQLNQEVNQAT